MRSLMAGESQANEKEPLEKQTQKVNERGDDYKAGS